jgi:hypothetical protein
LIYGSRRDTVAIDLIDIALDRMTDFTEFERLASEIMYEEGWIDIKPLGGVADLGQDAVSERIYRPEGDISRTVFQYTLQEYLPGKVDDTIEVLRKNHVEFTELIVVTRHAISSEAQMKMKRDARITYKVALDIYERKTLANRLAHLENGIYNRHFQNFIAQMEDVTRAASKSSIPEPALERALLQASLALTFLPGALRVRKSVFDYFVLALVLSEPQQCIKSADAVLRAASALKSDKSIPLEQIEAAFGRLEKMKLVKYSDGEASATAGALASVATSTVRLNEATSSFAADLVSEVRSALSKRLPAESERRIARNAREVLLEIARSRGAALDEQRVLIDDRLTTLAKHQLSDEVGDALIAAIADTLRSPTEEQATTMTRWTQTYLTFAVMGLDPTLNAFQASRFNKKTFILDTDVVLEAIVGDGFRSPGLCRIIASLLRMGARVLIPETVLMECVEHAQRSHKTYNYFGHALLQLTPAVVEERVWNVFVKGYYSARLSNRIPDSVSYSEYLSNFYEPRNARQFLYNVVMAALPNGVEIASLASVRPDRLTDHEIEDFAERLKVDLTGSKKSRYRRDEDEEKLARTDATLFLTALRINPADESTSTDVLGGACYLVTETLRYTRVARSLGVHTTVTVRPSALASLQELIGTFEVPPAEFVQLFDNQLLESVVENVWPDLEKLVRSGVSLRGKSLQRLRFDLDNALHAQILSLSKAEEDEESNSEATDAPDEQFLELLNIATKRGYSLIPEVDAIRVRIDSSEQRAHELQAVLDEVNAKNKELEQQIAFFGKRKQRYLRRFLRGEKQPK